MSNSPRLMHWTPQDLFVGDSDLIRCAEEHGTPCYVYDLRWIAQRWRLLKEALPSGSELCYSVKANPNKNILSTLSQQRSFFDAASMGEVRRLLEIGVEAKNISYVAPSKSIHSITEAILAGVGSIAIDSPDDFRRICEVAKKESRKQAVLFRLNPGRRSRGGLSMSGRTQFGMMQEDIIVCWKEALSASNWLGPIGLHCYQGTNILDAESIANEVSQALALFSHIAHAVGARPAFLNFGGGFGSPVQQGEIPLDVERLGALLRDMFADRCSKCQDAALYFESGRFIVGGGGIFLARVNDIKILYDVKYALLDAGINVYGGLSRSNAFRPAPIKVLTSRRLPEKITLCGPLCTPLDVLATDIELPSLKCGDVIAFYNAGAYQHSASPGNFVGFGYPLEVCIH